MAATFNDEQIRELQETFSRFDKDGNGSISTSELGIMLKELGAHPTQKEVDQMIGEVDHDGSGTIEFPEFLIMFIKKMKDTDVEKEIEEAFRVFDRYETGYVNVTDLRKAMLESDVLSQQEIEDFCLKADTQGAGEFCYLEFIKNMMSVLKSYRV